jgi:hypothetical protein
VGLLKTVGNVLSVLGLIAGLGAVGKFIDWYFDKPWVKPFKDWLLRGWVKFDDMHWYNFSKNEAQYFLGFFDRVFGSKLFGWRRLASGIATFLLLLMLFQLVDRSDTSQWESLKGANSHHISIVITTICSFCLSISVTQWTSRLVVRLATSDLFGQQLYMILFGPLAFATLLVVHCLLFAGWFPISLLISLALEETMQLAPSWWHDLGRTSDFFEIFWLLYVNFKVFAWQEIPKLQIGWNPVPILHHALFTMGFSGVASYHPPLYEANAAMGYLAYSLRIVFGLVLLTASVLREWLSRFVSRLWALIYESNDGAFTLIFGGVGAVAGFLKWLLSPN